MDNKIIMDGLLKPKAIAVIGASPKPGKIGYSVLNNLIKEKYTGKVYPIHPSEEEILGLKSYKSVLDVPGPIDAAVMTIPADLVLKAVEECGKKGIKGIHMITSGFGEIGRVEEEKELVRTANKYGMRILGPNIVGTLCNDIRMNASFCAFLPFPGKASLVSQSGALVIAIDAATYLRGVGFEKMISIGNMADINIADCVEWLDQDENTTCISLYIEGFRDGRRFIDVARKARKPIVAIKSGVSAHGAVAAASHTGSLAGAAKIYSAAFNQAGVIQSQDLNNLFDRTLALSLMSPMLGDNMLIITNGGGIGVLATDAAEKSGIPLQFAPPDVQAELKKHMPTYGSAKNPVDITGMAGPDWYVDAVRFSLTHPWLNGLCVLYCETAITDPLDIAKSIHTAYKESGVKDKPVTVCFVGGERSEKAMHWLVEQGIPAYDSPDAAVDGMAALREYAHLKQDLNTHEIRYTDVDSTKAREIIRKARQENRTALTEIEAKAVFEAYGLKTTKTTLATSEEEAVSSAAQIGFPVVMKIVSPDIIHKSDAGGVKVNIKSKEEVQSAYRTILDNARKYKADANIHGIAIQEMAPQGTEVILGSVNDPTFGPTVMFGLGGIFVEVLKDVTFRVAPISSHTAESMLDEIRGAPILAGVRGEKPRDRKAMAETASRYSFMIMDLNDEISETDANPIFLYENGKGITIVDARIILKAK